MSLFPHVHSVSYHAPWDDANVQHLEFVRTTQEEPEQLVKLALLEELNGNLPVDLVEAPPYLDHVMIDGVAVEHLDMRKATGFSE